MGNPSSLQGPAPTSSPLWPGSPGGPGRPGLPAQPGSPSPLSPWRGNKVIRAGSQDPPYSPGPGGRSRGLHSPWPPRLGVSPVLRSTGGGGQQGLNQVRQPEEAPPIHTYTQGLPQAQLLPGHSCPGLAHQGCPGPPSLLSPGRTPSGPPGPGRSSHRCSEEAKGRMVGWRGKTASLGQVGKPHSKQVEPGHPGRQLSSAPAAPPQQLCSVLRGPTPHHCL